jgi:hypothetical protein
VSIPALLSRLSGVKQTGAGRWIAKCPAHEDRRPSLSIRELDDGRVLLHDFGGCSVKEVLQSASLTFEALFPEGSPRYHAQRERRPFNAYDVLQCIVNEALILSISSIDLRKGVPLSETDHARLLVAEQRINAAVELVSG